jgi:tRNA 2-selenouridine synthase
MEDYDFFVQDPEFFCQRLGALTQLRGKAQVEQWQSQVRAGDVVPVVRELLVKHYDPGYAASIQRNFKQFGQARVIAPRNRSREAMMELAQSLRA